MTKKLAERKTNLVDSTKFIDVKDLVLNDDNPRIKYYVKNPTQEQIRKIMFDEFDVRSLKKRILSDGQVYDPLYIQKVDGAWLVHDGNSRTVAVTSIIEDIRNGDLEGTTEKDWAKLKCQVIRSNATPAEIRKLTSQKHIAGEHPWEAIAQAGNIYLMIKHDQDSEQSVANHLGMSISEVRLLYRAYENTIEFGKRHGGRFQTAFIYWYEFNSSPTLRDEAKSDSGFIDQFMQWITDGKIINHKQIRSIAKWYKDGKDKPRKKALAEMNRPKGTAAEAIELFNELSLESALTVIRKTQKILGQFNQSSLLTEDEIVELKKATDGLQKKVTDIKTWIKNKLADKAGRTTA